MNKDRESAMRELLSAIQSLIHDHQVYWGSVDQKPEEEAKELQMLHEGLLNLRDNTSGLRRNQDELKATIESVEESLLKRAYNLRDRVEAIEDNLSDGGVLISRKELLVRLEAVEKKLNSSRYYEPVSPSTPSVAPTSPLAPFGLEAAFEEFWKNPNPPIRDTVKDIAKDAFIAGYNLTP